MAPAMRTVHGTGACLHYITFGEKNKPCLMFIHGAGGNCVSWFQNIPHFRSKYFIISVSYRGWGASELESNTASLFDPEHFGRDIISVLDAEGIVEAALVAQSFGGYVAVRTAFEFPERVSCVVMSNTFLGFCDAPDAAYCPLGWLFKFKDEDKASVAWALKEARRITTSLRGEENVIHFASEEARTKSFCSKLYAEQQPILHGLYEQVGLCNVQMHQLKLRSKLGVLCANGHKCTVTPAEFRKRFNKPLHFITSLDDGLIQWEFVEYVATQCGADVTVKCFGSEVGHSPYYEIPEVRNALHGHPSASIRLNVGSPKPSASASPPSLSLSSPSSPPPPATVWCLGIQCVP
jgi:3-oxoadipate enol-lactonase